ncbi:hypothetical protein OE88DRAFT_1652083 [Heliocybe sulcata]|uniref:Protein kinase domain-containing protein n=1 Tax=Heliocybe sulcata TaxID=5364 RepID=A0A5C3NFB0_9AGAM|nr:hypothetical protein OE88DRAFT_1652083 [Heliocybe sulcata]
MDEKWVFRSPRLFVDTHLPVPRGRGAPPRMRRSTKPFDRMKNIDPANENAMYATFRECVEKYRLCPNYTFVATPHAADPNDGQGKGCQMPDLGLYRSEDVGGLHAKNGKPKPDWAKVCLTVEVKSIKQGYAADPFVDGEGEISEPGISNVRRSSRGQTTGYAMTQWKHQQRVFLFSLQILGTRARFFRWDKSGSVVTRAFDYIDEPQIMVDFLWRLCHMSDVEQGWDPTAELIDRESAEGQSILNDAKLDCSPPHVISYWKESLEGDRPLWKLKVGGCTCGSHSQKLEDGEPSTELPAPARYFYVGKPHFVAYGMTGRGTRGYIAMDIETKQLCYLKDCWRISLEGIEREGDVLRTLHASGAKYVPTLICDGDVCSCGHPESVDAAYPQSMLTDTLWEGDPYEKNPLKSHIHYRMAVQEIGKPLSTFENSRELVRVIRLAIKAHRDAYQKAGVLHRDISAGNILINVTRAEDGEWKVGALLNDWDLSKNIHKLGSPRQPDRTGTWEFMSIALLQDCGKVHEVSDDLESFIHVLVYEAVRYLPLMDDLSDVSVPQFMRQYFDASIGRADGQMTGGHCKRANVLQGYLGLTGHIQAQNAHIDGIISVAFSWLAAHYHRLSIRRSALESVLTTSTQFAKTADDQWNARMEKEDIGSDEDGAEDIDPAPQSPIDDGRAARIATHIPLMRLFREHLLDRSSWDPADRDPGEDRLKNKPSPRPNSRKRLRSTHEPAQTPSRSSRGRKQKARW